jgi:GGDEF domain-containing protein
VQITISIGFHLDRPGNGKVESLIDNLIDKAEQALYMDKEKGMNQTQAFS